MGHHTLAFQNVSFSYLSSTSELIKDFSLDITPGWVGIVGANGTGKSTLLKLAAQELVPDSGRISFSGNRVYCRQRTDDMPDRFIELVTAYTKVACKIMGELEIDPEWPYRWSTLSHGERKRAQIATALYKGPDLLAVDEPTNHLDIGATEWMMQTLGGFKGIGLLVSHDRTLLDHLCKKCIFIDPPDLMVFPGNYSQSLEQKQAMEKRMRKTHSQARHRVNQLQKEADRRRKTAFESDRRTSKKRIHAKDHDAKSRIDLVRVSGKDGSGGKLLNQISGRLSQARQQLDNIHIKKEYRSGIRLTGSRSKRTVLFRLKKGSLGLSDQKQLSFDNLVIRPEDRIGITGNNGSGKSRLVEHIIGNLDLDDDRICYLPQEVDLSAGMEKMATIRKQPGDALGKMMILISRLGSRPERILETTRPSPGEVRKILLAEGISKNPQLIIMDEPTNHLDLPSVEALEQALVSCESALLLVSHDRLFLDRLTHKRWEICAGNNREKEPCKTRQLILTERLV